MVWLIVLSVAVVALGCAIGYDVRARRQGQRVRTGRDILDEAQHNRLDIQSQGGGIHGPRDRGEFDWATHRRRARRR